ncbi:DUF1349 domain-containing protein [Paenibacillus sp. CAA11]|uniref:DUF1349 domain-containing protein n=1 Tax=Paenibacillus sp. CAA11 TaxID=1532905 RepID=UPI000D385B63|nr:DUF1349 domain-containing protein [Paenibacillus sp. CAA11]AWB46355.1 DUF1349 domain-containing protein [Paenibacillus sp. CAA11]
MQKIDLRNYPPEGFHWLHEPASCKAGEHLLIRTLPDTDLWQRTHYGFKRDNGHCLLTSIQGDFAMEADLEYEPNQLYDQCGIIIRVNEENWIKASVEYENEDYSRLGSVVTNLGYSDWATTDISSASRKMSYRISRRGHDFLIEQSYEGTVWHQMRIAHLHHAQDSLLAGIYAASPQGSGFECRVTRVAFGKNTWLPE